MPVTYAVSKDDDLAWICFGSRFGLQEVLDAVAGFRAEGAATPPHLRHVRRSGSLAQDPAIGGVIAFVGF